MHGNKQASDKSPKENDDRKSVINEDLSTRAATISDPLDAQPRQKYNSSSSLISVHTSTVKKQIPLTSLSIKNQVTSDDDNKPSMVEQVQKLTDFYSQRTKKALHKMCEMGSKDLNKSEHNHAGRGNQNENRQHHFYQNVEMTQQTASSSKSVPRSSHNHPYYHNHNNNMPTQTVMVDAINPSVVGPTNIRFVTTDEREQRDIQLTQALNIISESMKPPDHNVDVIRNWVLDECKPNEGSADNSCYVYFYKLLAWFMGTPFTILRTIWNYIILEIHLVYNLGLLYLTFCATPPLCYFIIGLTLFWMKVIYEIYRDIMHRDDPAYVSQVPKEMSIAAAISASMGFVLNMKAKNGEINKAWWRGETV